MTENHIFLTRFAATVIIISIGPFICGVALGFSSLVSSQLLIGDYLIAFFSSVINLGALIGCLIVGAILNTLGRRTALLISAVPSVFGWLLIAAAQGLSPPSTVVEPRLVFSLIFGRVLSGLAAGMMNAVCSVYLVEIAPAHHSGLVGSLAQFATVAGCCFAYYCGMVATWYETAELMVVISGVLLGATFYLAESPAWLAKRTQMSLQDITRYRLEVSSCTYSSVDCEEPSLLHLRPNPTGKLVLEDITLHRSSKSQSIGSILLPCLNLPPELRANFRIAILLMVAQQTTGINVITFYTQPLCQRMVYASHSAFCAFALGLAQLFFSLITSFFIIDRLPRRRLVMATGALMASSMFLFAIGQRFPNSAPFPPLAPLLVFLLGYQCGWGPLAPLITMELFPANHRGNAGAAAVAVGWGATFMVTQAFQPIVNLFGREGAPVVFVTHAVLTLLATVYFHSRLPETNPLFFTPTKLTTVGAPSSPPRWLVRC